MFRCCTHSFLHFYLTKIGWNHNISTGRPINFSNIMRRGQCPRSLPISEKKETFCVRLVWLFKPKNVFFCKNCKIKHCQQVYPILFILKTKEVMFWLGYEPQNVRSLRERTNFGIIYKLMATSMFLVLCTFRYMCFWTCFQYFVWAYQWSVRF